MTVSEVLCKKLYIWDLEITNLVHYGREFVITVIVITEFVITISHLFHLKLRTLHTLSKKIIIFIIKFRHTFSSTFKFDDIFRHFLNTWLFNVYNTDLKAC